MTKPPPTTTASTKAPALLIRPLPPVICCPPCSKDYQELPRVTGVQYSTNGSSDTTLVNYDYLGLARWIRWGNVHLE